MSERWGPLGLLVLQPTPFCNLDCTYCYLPDRGNTARMAPEVLERTFARVAESGLVTRPYTIVWHAGEPMVLPLGFYEEAFAIAARHADPAFRVVHSFQTNATLIDEEWCGFFRRHDVRVGVSVDGPAFLHDARRLTRSGRGTHARVVEGMRCLRQHDVPFHVIAVLTREALDYPDEMHAFFVEHGVEQVGFNIEEIEGPNTVSSLGTADTAARYRAFMDRFFDLATGADAPLAVREFDTMIGAVLRPDDAQPLPPEELAPFAIVSVDCDGNFSTFSPELLGLPSPHYDGFALGNVRDHSFAEAAQTARFRAMAADIARGTEHCRASCAWYRFCGGGAPANKYFENGTFASTETLFCRLHRQALADVVLAKLSAATAGAERAV